MILENDLRAAIAHLQGENNPDINTCIKLAACLICQKELFSASPAPTEAAIEPVGYSSDTEFGAAIKGKTAASVWPLFDELMSTLSVIQPRLYDSVMRRLSDI